MHIRHEIHHKRFELYSLHEQFSTPPSKPILFTVFNTI
ncbi:hypothetical protein SynA15127_00277 [Synechococcus sp. A15-127]|nr:hypothetical protein SynA15127_00277 [Synechococcus sp. A15-127]